MANFSHAINDPFSTTNLLTANVVNDGTYFGSHMEYLATLIDQTNAYGDQINTAANAGSTMSTLYDANNPIAVQLRYVAQMISGGLQTKVYILNINGFDTHDAQVVATDTTTGNHTNLLKTLSDAVAAFQDDITLLGLESRVAGMTFSEFGRQIASNGSKGTDHGDAAPMFLFGACINSGIIGPDPVIDAAIDVQVGVPMQIDFRDVYASILKDWFEVPSTEIQGIFDHTVTFYQVLGACNLGIEEEAFEKDGVLLFPNPAVSYTTLRLKTDNEWVKVEIFDLEGRLISVVYDGNLDQNTHLIKMEIDDLIPGQYIVAIKKRSGFKEIKLMKVK
jgi:hypothetical protein